MTEQEWLQCEDPVKMLCWISPVSTRAYENPSWRPVSERQLRLYCDTIRHEFYHGNIRKEWSGWESSLHMQSRLKDEAIPAEQAAREWAAELSMKPWKAAVLRDLVGNPWRSITLQTSWLTPTVLELARTSYEELSRKCKQCCGKGGLEYEPGCVISKYCDCRGTGCTYDVTLDPARLAVLSDALEEAGCDDQDILLHLRGKELCFRCMGKKTTPTLEEWKLSGSQLQPAEGWGMNCAECKGAGYIPLRGHHVRGCWALGLSRGKDNSNAGHSD